MKEEESGSNDEVAVAAASTEEDFLNGLLEAREKFTYCYMLLRSRPELWLPRKQQQQQQQQRSRCHHCEHDESPCCAVAADTGVAAEAPEATKLGVYRFWRILALTRVATGKTAVATSEFGGSTVEKCRTLSLLFAIIDVLGILLLSGTRGPDDLSCSTSFGPEL